MKVALIGASGNVGSRILNELLDRGHQVTGIVPHPEKLSPRERLSVQRGDVNDAAGLAPLLVGQDAVISSVRFEILDPHALISAVKQAGVSRLLVVGGAGSLEVAPGVPLLDTPAFPDVARPEAQGGRAFLDLLRGEKALDWTFLSPSAMIFPGQRTGTFRLGADQLLVDAAGESRISMEDFAVAMVDELETPHHSRQRFTVGY